MMNRKFTVSIVGRPNVGKSTLFNRLTGSRKAIVNKAPGITRDIIEQDIEWLGSNFTIVDTAGFDRQLEDTLKEIILEKLEEQIKRSDLVVFMVDAKDGITATDKVFAELLRKTGTPYILAANKVDDFNNYTDLTDFYRFGMGEPVPLSAQQGKNIGDLLDVIVSKVPKTDIEEEKNPPLKIAIIGQPNAGKSSLLNQFLGYERVLVHDVPGTTRDSIDTLLDFEDDKYLLLDTAGIRKRFRRGDWLEKLSTS